MPASTPCLAAAVPGAGDRLAARIVEAVLARARAAGPAFFADCAVLVAGRTIVVAGTLGFWPPLGAFEGVRDEAERQVRRVLRDVRAAAPDEDAPDPDCCEVIVRLERLPSTRARALAAAGSGHAAATTTVGLRRDVASASASTPASIGAAERPDDPIARPGAARDNCARG